MANLFDCPREIRDCIYSAYFTSELKANPTKPLHTLPLLRSNRSIAVEAIEAAKPVLARTIRTVQDEAYNAWCAKQRAESDYTSATHPDNRSEAYGRLIAYDEQEHALKRTLHKQAGVAQDLEVMLEDLIGEAAQT